MPPIAGSNPAAASWFSGVPVAKLLSFATFLSYTVLQARKAFGSLEWNTVDEDARFELYRLFTSKLTFTTTSELIMGTVLLATLARQYERELGSAQFTLFLCLVNCLTMLVELVMLNINYLYSYGGPYPALGALFYCFHRYSPRLYPRFVSILGFNLSEKSLWYLWFLFTVLRTRGSRVSVAIGFLCGIISIRVLRFVQVPLSLETALSNLLYRYVDAPPRMFVPQTQNPFAAAAAPNANVPRPTHPLFGQRAPDGDSVRDIAQRQRHPVEADPAAIEQLMAMGFERDQVVQALQMANNDVNRAADRLLSS